MNRKFFAVLSSAALLLPLVACSSTPEAGTTPPAGESPVVTPPAAPPAASPTGSPSPAATKSP